VLESLAFNIVARIDDLLYVDDLSKHSDQFSSLSKVGVIAHKSLPISFSVPVSSTPYKTAFATPSFSPSQLVSPAKGERSPFITSSKIPQHGIGVKKVLTDYLGIDTNEKDYENPFERSDTRSNTMREVPASQTEIESAGCTREPVSSPEKDSIVEERHLSFGL
jgi:hypothetical protein